MKKALVCLVFIVLFSSIVISVGEASSSAFLWWQNHELDIETEKIAGTDSEDATNYTVADLANITVGINNTDSEALNTTHFSGALLIEVVNSTGSVKKVFSAGEDIYIASDEKEYESYTNDFSGLAVGTYTVRTRFVYDYPTSNLTLLNQSYLPVNASSTIYVVATPPGPGGGGGRGPAIVLRYYYADVSPKKLHQGDTAEVYINISNTGKNDVTTTVRAYVMKNFKIINEKDTNITTLSQKVGEDTLPLFTSSCTSDPGEYDVKVEFYESDRKIKTIDLKFEVMPCKNAKPIIRTGKSVYYPDEEMTIEFEVENRGNMDLTGRVELSLKNETWQIPIANITDVTVEREEMYKGDLNINLNIESSGIYQIELKYVGDDFVSKTDTTVIISQEAATVMNIIVWLILAAVLILIVLAAMQIYKSTQEIVNVYKDQNQT
jgi:hypothetical protein